MINFIGDLSKKDVQVLTSICGIASTGILEFGVGGSTQIIARLCQNTNIPFVSVDTSKEWINITKENLKRFGILTPIQFMEYNSLIQDDQIKSINADVILVDGIDNLRLDFAVRVWNILQPNGKMLFHDTRRRQDVSNVANLLINVFEEVEKIELNYLDSNISVVTKRFSRLPYEDWNQAEGKDLWMYNGSVPPPTEHIFRIDV